MQNLQPSYSHISGLGLGGTAEAGLTGNILGNGKSGGGPQEAAGSGKDTVSLGRVQGAQIPAHEAGMTAAAGTLFAVEADGENKISGVIESEQKKSKRSIDYRKYMRKMQNGVQAFLQGMRSKAGKERRERSEKLFMTEKGHWNYKFLLPMSFLFSESASFSVFIIRIQQIGRIDLHLVNIFFRDVSCCAVLLLFGLLPPFLQDPGKIPSASAECRERRFRHTRPA